MKKCDNQHIAISFEDGGCPLCVLLEGIDKAKSLLEVIDYDDSDDAETNVQEALRELSNAIDSMGKSRLDY